MQNSKDRQIQQEQLRREEEMFYRLAELKKNGKTVDINLHFTWTDEKYCPTCNNDLFIQTDEQYVECPNKDCEGGTIYYLYITGNSFDSLKFIVISQNRFIVTSEWNDFAIGYSDEEEMEYSSIQEIIEFFKEIEFFEDMPTYSNANSYNIDIMLDFIKDLENVDDLKSLEEWNKLMVYYEEFNEEFNEEK